MVSATDISADKLIKSTAEKLKKDELMRPPKWSAFVKTGPHVQKKPDEKDWWYIRCASILRRSYIEGVVGVGTLRTWYGGRKNRGSKPEKHVDASGNILRKAVQTLEKAGYLKKEKAGRSLSSKGRSLLHKSALENKGGLKSGARGIKTNENEGVAAKTGTGAEKKPAVKPTPRSESKGKDDKSKVSKS